MRPGRALTRRLDLWDTERCRLALNASQNSRRVLRPKNYDYREYNSTTSCSFTIGAISSRVGIRVTLPWN